MKKFGRILVVGVSCLLLIFASAVAQAEPLEADVVVVGAGGEV